MPEMRPRPDVKADGSALGAHSHMYVLCMYVCCMYGGDPGYQGPARVEREM